MLSSQRTALLVLQICKTRTIVPMWEGGGRLVTVLPGGWGTFASSGGAVHEGGWPWVEGAENGGYQTNDTRNLQHWHCLKTTRLIHALRAVPAPAWLGLRLQGPQLWR